MCSGNLASLKSGNPAQHKYLEKNTLLTEGKYYPIFKHAFRKKCPKNVYAIKLHTKAYINCSVKIPQKAIPKERFSSNVTVFLVIFNPKIILSVLFNLVLKDTVICSVLKPDLNRSCYFILCYFILSVCFCSIPYFHLSIVTPKGSDS